MIYDGLRVVDCTTGIASAYCTKLLADLGADVVFGAPVDGDALFTYLRPFLEQVTGFSVSALSLVLLIMGLAGVAGTCRQDTRWPLFQAPNNTARAGMNWVGRHQVRGAKMREDGLKASVRTVSIIAKELVPVKMAEEEKLK